MEQQLVCSSCKKRITNTTGTVTFGCPGCKTTPITRCTQCRKVAARYTCHNCGMSGPN